MTMTSNAQTLKDSLKCVRKLKHNDLISYKVTHNYYESSTRLISRISSVQDFDVNGNVLPFFTNSIVVF